MVCPFLELKEAVEDVLPSLIEKGVTILLMTKHCDTPGIESFSDKLDKASDTPLPRFLRSHIAYKSPAVYIYTSGTTGIRVVAFVFQFHLIICSHNNIISVLQFCAVCVLLYFRSPKGSCGQSESPLNSSGCFIFKRCNV